MILRIRQCGKGDTGYYIRKKWGSLYIIDIKWKKFGRIGAQCKVPKRTFCIPHTLAIRKPVTSLRQQRWSELVPGGDVYSNV